MEADKGSTTFQPGSVVPAGLAHRLFVRDDDGIPIGINFPEYWEVLRDSNPDVSGAAETIRDIEPELEQSPTHHQRVLLRCAADVASAIDCYLAAERLCNEPPSVAPQENPAVDQEIRSFLRPLLCWPSRNAQPLVVTRALEETLADETSDDEIREVCRLFHSRSIDDFFKGSLHVILAADPPPSLVYLPKVAYGYFLPIALELVLRRHGRLCDQPASVTANFRPSLTLHRSLGWFYEDFDREHFCGAIADFTQLQRQTFYDFLQLVRRRPDVFPDRFSQMDAAACHHFFWSDRANWVLNS